MNWYVIAIFSAGFVLLLWDARRKRKRDELGGEDSGDDGGGGGGWDTPKGTPPGGGGPDRNIDQMFHEVADAIGKSIKIDEKDKEQVLQ